MGLQRRLSTLLCAVVAFVTVSRAQPPGGGAEVPVAGLGLIATVHLIGNGDNSSIRGDATLTEQTNHWVRVVGQLAGLQPNASYGMHVHQFGNLTHGNCSNAGEHWNPYSCTHGDVADASRPRHSGDLGNVQSDANGVAHFDVLGSLLRLRGCNTVLGRSLVVHEHRDDLGLGGQPNSLVTGNSGGRLACGVIGLASAGGPCLGRRGCGIAGLGIARGRCRN